MRLVASNLVGASVVILPEDPDIEDRRGVICNVYIPDEGDPEYTVAVMDSEVGGLALFKMYECTADEFRVIGGTFPFNFALEQPDGDWVDEDPGDSNPGDLVGEGISSPEKLRDPFDSDGKSTEDSQG